MIVWLNGSASAAGAVASIAASALEQRSFQVRAIAPGDAQGDDASGTLEQARDADGEGLIVLVAAGALEAPDGEEIFPFGVEDGTDAGRAAEALLDALEQAGHLHWGYSREEEEEIQKHLEDLGYL